ncbi:MAG: spore coat protein CotJB [Clostridia bacterium]|nr:spore coat protein CotJB [Clostridia bacterium]
MSEKMALMNKISEVSFAMYELHLFLDTHPNDATAMALLNKYSDTRNALAAEYQSKYGPLNTYDVDTNNKWLWNADPWPWEYGANMEA